MGNVNKWMGPLSLPWMKGDSELQKKILARERSLGMTPVLPAFAGHVPAELAVKYPETNISRSTGWGGFNESFSTYYLSPAAPLFATIGTRFVQMLVETYGTDHLYNADPYAPSPLLGVPLTLTLFSGSTRSGLQAQILILSLTAQSRCTAQWQQQTPRQSGWCRVGFL